MATDALRQRRTTARPSIRPVVDETKASFKTTEFWAMLGLIAAILIASAISDSLNDVRAWTLVAAVGIGYMLSRGLAKSGSTYRGGEDILAGGNPARGVTESDSLDEDLRPRASAGATRG
jgi:hypothetical protein